MAALLEVRGLSVDYVTDAGDVRAVDRVDLRLRAGEFLAIVGESGCGKSTLLFAIAQLLSPPAEIAAGSVTFAGPGHGHARRERAAARALARLLGGDAERDERPEPDEEHRGPVRATRCGRMRG